MAASCSWVRLAGSEAIGFTIVTTELISDWCVWTGVSDVSERSVVTGEIG